MELNESRILAIVVSCDAPAGTLLGKLRRNVRDSLASGYPIRVNCSGPQKIYIKGQHFTITGLQHDSQLTAPIWPRSQAWTWEITANRPGRRLLYVDILASLRRHSGEQLDFSDQLYWFVNVYASKGEYAKGLLDRMAPTLLGGLITFLAIIAWSRFGLPMPPQR